MPLAAEFINSSDSTPGKIRPYICFGFKIEDAVIYLSDASHIPEETWSLLRPSKESGVTRPPPVFVVDCLRPLPHTSHFGLRESMAAVRRMGARRSYLTGFGHEVTHEEYVAISEAAGKSSGMGDVVNASETVRVGLELVGKGNPVWVRPAFDGLSVSVAADGSVTDSSY